MGPLRRFGACWEAHVVPRMVNKMCAATPVAEMRDRVTAGLHGTVGEVGFGSGLNLPPLPPSVDRLLAVAPARTGGRRAAERHEASARPAAPSGPPRRESP